MDTEIFPPTMKTQTIAVNVDDCDDDEREALIAHPATHAEVRRYAELKREAIRLRLAGNIGTAVRLEAKLDRIYETLPKRLRW